MDDDAQPTENIEADFVPDGFRVTIADDHAVIEGPRGAVRRDWATLSVAALFASTGGAALWVALGIPGAAQAAAVAATLLICGVADLAAVRLIGRYSIELDRNGVDTVFSIGGVTVRRTSFAAGEIVGFRFGFVPAAVLRGRGAPVFRPAQTRLWLLHGERGKVEIARGIAGWHGSRVHRDTSEEYTERAGRWLATLLNREALRLWGDTPERMAAMGRSEV